MISMLQQRCLYHCLYSLIPSLFPYSDISEALITFSKIRKSTFANLQNIRGLVINFRNFEEDEERSSGIDA